jgi:hypothetical protein
MLTKNNGTHDAEYNAITLQEEYLHRFGIEMDTDVNHMTSNTVSAAKAVSNYVEDIKQVDCEMHVVSLALLYGIGLRENMKTVFKVDEVGTRRKTRSITNLVVLFQKVLL